MKRRERGFFVIEIIIALAIISPIVLALTMTTTLLLRHHERGTNQNLVLCQVQNAGHWISHDVRMADNVTCGETNGFPLTLNIPLDTSGNRQDIHYLFADGKLMRQVYNSSQNLTAETLIAEYIDIGNTSFSPLEDPNTYKLTVKATKDEAVVAREYEVNQRLSSS